MTTSITKYEKEIADRDDVIKLLARINPKPTEVEAPTIIPEEPMQNNEEEERMDPD